MTTRKTIAFDLRWIGRDYGGITTNALNLLPALTSAENEFRFLVIVNPGQDRLISRYVGAPVSGLELLTVRHGLFSLANQFLLPSELRRAGVDLYHSPMYLGLALPGSLKVVVTVYDLIAYLHPESSPRTRTARYYPAFAFALRRSLAAASAIIVSSQATADDLARAFPSYASRATVIHVPLNPVFFQPADPVEVADARREFGTAERLLLYVGRLSPYKNLVALVKALAGLRSRGIDAGLVLAGCEDGYYQEPELAARKLGVEQFVRRTGYLELGRLRALFQAADVLVLPSKFEGFGLPPVEAMASGTPVVCSNRTSLPEITGDAALLVEPDDPESIVAAIRRILTEPLLREDLIRRGHERAHLYTRDAAARKTFEVYRRLLSS